MITGKQRSGLPVTFDFCACIVIFLALPSEEVVQWGQRTEKFILFYGVRYHKKSIKFEVEKFINF